MLQIVARVMQQHVRASDICARYGGEEFAMLLPQTPGENAAFMANRLRRTLSGTRYTGLGLAADATITISMGVATCPRDATEIDELLDLADQALYRAKAEGRNQVMLYGVDSSRCSTTARPRVEATDAAPTATARSAACQTHAPADERRRRRAPVEQGVVEGLERSPPRGAQSRREALISRLPIR